MCSICPGQQLQGGGDATGVKIKLQHSRCRAQAVIARTGKSLDLSKACKDLCTFQSKAKRAPGTQLQALTTERWELHALLHPMAETGKGIPLVPAEAGCLTATSTRGDARSPQVCIASLNYPRAKSQGLGVPAQHRLAPHTAVLCHLQMSCSHPYVTQPSRTQPVL